MVRVYLVEEVEGAVVVVLLVEGVEGAVHHQVKVVEVVEGEGQDHQHRPMRVQGEVGLT